jgi:hypothetical protein
MYFVRKKDLIITGKVYIHIVEFQLSDYCKDSTIIIKHLEYNIK